MRALSSLVSTVGLPLLLRLEPELAHSLALRAAGLLRHAWPPIDAPAELAVECAGLEFAHPVGLAAGFDKDGDHVDALGAMGFSHIEVGTVTPVPQPGNPRPRIARLRRARAIVNRMGFNSKGVDHVVRRLERRTYRGVVGVSIGKNAATPLDEAVGDYLHCLRAVYPVADYVAVNVSSPNTPRLRELQSASELLRLIAPLEAERERLAVLHGRRAPIFVKVSPDLSDDALDAFAREIASLEVDGVIATNSTVDLGGLDVPAGLEGGGLSGEPLHRRSTAVIARLRAALGPSVPIIGVGGITTPERALETLAAGANLVQLYTGFVYRGTALLDEILDALLAQRGGRGDAGPGCG